MLADKFYEFLESIVDPLDDPYVVDYGKEIFVEGHIPKDKLEEFLKGIESVGFRRGQDEVIRIARDTFKKEGKVAWLKGEVCESIYYY